MKHIVGIAEIKISSVPGDVIVTHALGSCLGITIHDPVAHVGGMLHVMMPTSTINREKARTNPYMFVDTAVPMFFREVYQAGAVKNRLEVKVAGGANVHNVGKDSFAIGKRNFIVLKKLFWKNNVIIESSDVGGSNARTLFLEIGSGHTWMSTTGTEKEL